MLLLAAMIGCIVIAIKTPEQKAAENLVKETEVHTTGGTVTVISKPEIIEEV
jgi:hypothetical protein